MVPDLFKTLRTLIMESRLTNVRNVELSVVSVHSEYRKERHCRELLECKKYIYMVKPSAIPVMHERTQKLNEGNIGIPLSHDILRMQDDAQIFLIFMERTHL